MCFYFYKVVFQTSCMLQSQFKQLTELILDTCIEIMRSHLVQEKKLKQFLVTKVV